MKSKDSNSKKCVRVALGVPRLIDGFGWAACVIKISMDPGRQGVHNCSIPTKTFGVIQAVRTDGQTKGNSSSPLPQLR